MKNADVHVSSKLKSLCPYTDAEGLIRVGGRLQHSNLHDEQKHPIILPKHGHLTRLIIEAHHIRHLHSGITLTLAALREQYWILGAKDTVRFTINRCIRCRRIKATSQQQQMGQLPAGRVIPSRPFLQTGVDFAGPFMVKMRKGRGASCDKCYFAVFVCLATKAVHLEAVTDLTTRAFIASLQRFMARRGPCSHIYSDCGTNFVGAAREIQRDVAQVELETQQHLSHLGVTFSRTTATASHQGGIWESAVKSTKYHLKRIIGNTPLTLEQFQTLLCNVESCMNSRPLCALSCDPTDISALTPGHFSVGAPLTSLPEPDLRLITTNRLDHWKLVQQMSQHFWTRWSKEYLSTLQPRSKWTRKHENIRVGDLVIIKDDCILPNQWKLGRVSATHPGSDGLVRSVTIRTILDATRTPVKYGELMRPVQKLSILMSSNEME